MTRTPGPLIAAASLGVLLAALPSAASAAPVALSLRADVHGETLRISGSASAPDGAWIIYAAYSEARPQTRAAGSMRVEHGRFAGQVDVSRWPRGKIGVDVNFQMTPPSPKQPPAVIARFGRDGERMTGQDVVQGGAGFHAAVASATAVKP